jgi:Mg/Co/Ni transporter MgtE
MTVEQARTRFREDARSRDVREYFYIVNGDGKLIGVASLDDVFMSADNTPLKDLMVENVITLRPETTVKEAANMFMRYLWRALPVVDEEEKILGVVPYRDVMQLKHRMLE